MNSLTGNERGDDRWLGGKVHHTSYNSQAQLKLIELQNVYLHGVGGVGVVVLPSVATVLDVEGLEVLEIAVVDDRL